jgi:hypothetical protein
MDLQARFKQVEQIYNERVNQKSSDVAYWQGRRDELLEIVASNHDGENPVKYEPYFGWCDVEGCENEGSSGGVGWAETGHWTICRKHGKDFRDGKPQPKMKQEAIDRENSRDKVTGFLPSPKL